MKPDDPLRRAVLSLLGPRPTPAKRREVAQQLRQLAEEQERLVDAEQRQQVRPVSERLSPRKPKAGPGRTPARFVRIEREERYGRERIIIFVGRGLYYDLGSPARLDVQLLAGRIELRPATGDDGYALNIGGGMPRFYADGARELLEGMADGRYSAEVRGGAIAVEGKLP